jgi:hypothetical protein
MGEMTCRRGTAQSHREPMAGGGGQWVRGGGRAADGSGREARGAACARPACARAPRRASRDTVGQGAPRAILRARARLAFTPAAGAYSIAPPA